MVTHQTSSQQHGSRGTTSIYLAVTPSSVVHSTQLTSASQLPRGYKHRLSVAEQATVHIHIKEATFSQALPAYPCPATEHLGCEVFYTNFNGQLNLVPMSVLTGKGIIVATTLRVSYEECPMVVFWQQQLLLRLYTLYLAEVPSVIDKTIGDYSVHHRSHELSRCWPTIFLRCLTITGSGQP